MKLHVVKVVDEWLGLPWNIVLNAWVVCLLWVALMW